MERAAIIETNIGDLIVALREEAAPYARNENEVHKMVALMLTHLQPIPARRHKLALTQLEISAPAMGEEEATNEKLSGD